MMLTEGLEKDFHIFSYCEPCTNATTAPGNCSMDLVFNPSSSYLGQNHRICLEAQLLWKKVTGEKRCFNMVVESGNVSLHGPCSNLHCRNGGFCNAGNAVIGPICHCPVGYSGNTCEEDSSTSITNNTNRPSAGNFVIPEEIICSYNESCSVPLQILGNPPSIPFVEPGHVPPTIDIEHLVLNSTNPTGTNLEGYLTIKSRSNGTERLCIQSKDDRNSSLVCEEICFNVRVTGELSRQLVDMSRPYYIDPTLPDGSTVMCKTETECHIVMFASNVTSNCSSITEVSAYTGDLHIFPPVSRLEHQCVTDISYIPPKDMEGQQKKICLQTSLPGLKGEIRCYNVISRANANLTTGLCINKKCSNGGQCLSSPLEARCICRLGYGGVECADTSETVAPPTDTSTSHGTGQPVFIDLAIPEMLICYENTECWLPVTVKGDVSHNKPIVKFGHIDPTLSPGTPTLDERSNIGVYSGNVPFTPSSLGQYRLCIQTADPVSHVNVDEICCNVTVLNSSLQATQPPFQKPTLNANSTVKCSVNTNCHILTYLDPENGTCSHMTQTGLVNNLFLFPPSTNDGKCVVDTIFTPSSNQTGENAICLKTVNSHNPRCVNVLVEQIVIARGPCSNLHCKNDGFCDIENATSQPLCYCPSGYSGKTCEDDASTSITNNTNRPAVGTLALPLQIECIYNASCFIPIQLLGQPPNTPFVEPGHVPPTINVENLAVNSTNPVGNTFEGYLQIKATGNGTHRVCIQGKDHKNSSRVLEEICFNVQVTDPLSRPQANMSQPYFIDPTFPDGSTVMCKTESACHILMYTSKTALQCPTISEVLNNTRGLHIFSPSSRMEYDCVTDVSYIPPKEMEGKQRKICLQASLSGHRGEIRCYIVVSLVNANLTTGLCINKECKNGGHCLSNSQEARCICRLGFSGVKCADTSSTVDPSTNLPPSHGTGQPVFIDLAIPDTLICYENTECWLPVTVKGDISNKPTVKFGHIDPTLSPGIPTLNDAIAIGVYSGNVPFTPSSVGQYRLCIQTADPVSHVNIDEICCNVTVLNSSLQPPQQPFQKPTLNANSTVKCAVDTYCHILTYLDPENGICSDLIQKGLVDNLFLFPPNIKNGKCVFDTIFAPSSNQTGENVICLNTRNSLNPRCLNVQVEQIVKGYGPCSNLHCTNDGFCDAENATGQPLCHCPSGFSGKTCDDDESTSITNNTNRPAVGNLALPLQIECIYNETCSIPIQLLGQPPNTPFVQPGHLPPTINVENLVVNSTNPVGKTFEGYLQIKVTGNGTQRVCIQSKDHKNSSRVSEETCFNVQVTNPFSRHRANMSQPYFIDPTFPDGSTVLCKTESACHILMYTSKTASHCPTILEVLNNTRGLHIFSPSSRIEYDCVTDVSYIPPNEMEGQQRKFCFQASLSGLRGEIRCYNVVSLVNANLTTGLCINKECKNGGQCLSNSKEARCICKLGYSGVKCTDTSETVDPPTNLLPSDGRRQPVFIDFAIPDTLICYEKFECSLPVTVKGEVRPIVKFGHIDPTLSKGEPTLDDGSNIGVYSGNVPFTPSSVGQYQLCIQTADSHANVDEICCHVTVLNSSLRPSQTPFQKPTLNENSTVKCQVNTTCHILTYMNTEHGKCPDLTLAGLIDNIYIFPASIKDGKCVVDTTFTPSGNQTGSNRICMNSRNNDNTRCLNVQVEQTIKVPAPCKKKHCQNNGVCQAINWTNAECNCTANFMGPQCESEISTSLPTTSQSTSPDTGYSLSTSASPTNTGTSLLTSVSTHSTSTPSFSTTVLSLNTIRTSLSMTTTSHSTAGTSQSTMTVFSSASHSSIGMSQSTIKPSSSTNHYTTVTSQTGKETSSSTSPFTIQMSQSTAETNLSTSHSTSMMSQSTNEPSSSTSHFTSVTSQSTIGSSLSTSHSITGTPQLTTVVSSSASHSNIESSLSTIAPSSSTSHSTSMTPQSTTVASSSASDSTIGMYQSTIQPSWSTFYSTTGASQSTAESVSSTSHSTTSAMCSATEETRTAERARELVKAGRMSCFCNITTPGTNDTKWIQVIRPRPVVTTSQMAKAGAVGAGAMVSVMVVVGVGVLVVKKLKSTKKTGDKRRPLPRLKPRIGPTRF